MNEVLSIINDIRWEDVQERIRGLIHISVSWYELVALTEHVIRHYLRDKIVLFDTEEYELYKKIRDVLTESKDHGRWIRTVVNEDTCMTLVSEMHRKIVTPPGICDDLHMLWYAVDLVCEPGCQEFTFKRQEDIVPLRCDTPYDRADVILIPDVCNVAIMELAYFIECYKPGSEDIDRDLTTLMEKYRGSFQH